MFKKFCLAVVEYLRQEFRAFAEAMIASVAICLFFLPALLALVLSLKFLRARSGIDLVDPVLDALQWPVIAAMFVAQMVFKSSARWRAFVTLWIRRVYLPLWKLLVVLVLRPLLWAVVPRAHEL